MFCPQGELWCAGVGPVKHLKVWTSWTRTNWRYKVSKHYYNLIGWSQGGVAEAKSKQAEKRKLIGWLVMQFTCWSEAFWPRRLLSKLLKQNPEWLVSEARPAVNQTAVTATVAPSKIHSLWKLAGDETKRVCERLNQQCLTTQTIQPAEQWPVHDTHFTCITSQQQRHTKTHSDQPPTLKGNAVVTVESADLKTAADVISWVNQ